MNPLLFSLPLSPRQTLLPATVAAFVSGLWEQRMSIEWVSLLLLIGAGWNTIGEEVPHDDAAAESGEPGMYLSFVCLC